MLICSLALATENTAPIQQGIHMILRSRKPAPETAAPADKATGEKRIDMASLFRTPYEYRDGSRKRLNAFHSGDWWLNVDYVDSESWVA